jgi:hypothetical protein
LSADIIVVTPAAVGSDLFLGRTLELPPRSRKVLRGSSHHFTEAHHIIRSALCSTHLRLRS